MSNFEQSANEVEILSTREFLDRSLGRAGVSSAAELTDQDKACILMAFHDNRCDVDWARFLPELEITDSQRHDVWEMLVLRSVEMRTMAELLIGYEWHGAKDNNRMEVFEGI